MKQAAFIRYFQYDIGDNVIHISEKENFTFSNLQADTPYYITGRVVTNDSKTNPLPEFHVNRTTDSDGKYNNDYVYELE